MERLRHFLRKQIVITGILLALMAAIVSGSITTQSDSQATIGIAVIYLDEFLMLLLLVTVLIWIATALEEGGDPDSEKSLSHPIRNRGSVLEDTEQKQQ